MQRFIVLAFALLATSCASKDDPLPVWDGLCDVTLNYTETASTPRVFVAGSFNGFQDSRDELLDDGRGHYSITLRLEPGLYPYKFVVHGDGDAEMWRLDPANAYRAYDTGTENSGLRVPNCGAPSLTVQEHSVDTSAHTWTSTLAYSANAAGSLQSVTAELRSGATSRLLTNSELSVSGDTIRLNLSGISNGKHVVNVVAAAANGTMSESLLLPFWMEETSFSWNDAVIYMVMTDRFKNGNTSNDPAPSDASQGADWEGGDFAGVHQAIDDGYFDRLGVNTLWLSPYNRNPEGTFADADETHLVAGYHGYWPIDPTHVDSRLGQEQELVDLIAAAHEHGIRVVMDLVLNHVHEEHPYFHDHPSWFNAGCICGTDGCDWTEHRLDCLFRPYLPDINWTNPEASEQIIDDALGWMERFDLDGFRVDAVKHVNDAAIFNLGTRTRERFETTGTEVFLMGETAMGWDSSSGPQAGGNIENYGTISHYIGPSGLTGQFDFVLYYAAALQFLTDTPGRGMAHIDYWSQESQREYPAGAIMTPYIGSHDTARFMTLASNPDLANNKWDNLPPAPNAESYDRMYTAFGWLFSLPGAPLLYYGDEYGEYGGADPDNRHMMRFGDALSTPETSQLARVQALLQARRTIPALRSRRTQTIVADEDLLVALRGEGDQSALVVINRGASTLHRGVPIASDLVEEGRELHDALATSYAVSVTRNAVTLDIPARSVRYLR